MFKSGRAARRIHFHTSKLLYDGGQGGLCNLGSPDRADWYALIQFPPGHRPVFEYEMNLVGIAPFQIFQSTTVGDPRH